jgi:hypothetical protein
MVVVENNKVLWACKSAIRSKIYREPEDVCICHKNILLSFLCSSVVSKIFFLPKKIILKTHVKTALI